MESVINKFIDLRIHVYIIEFKLDEKAVVALKQIRDKGYAEKFGMENREVVLVGVGFDAEKKSVGT